MPSFWFFIFVCDEKFHRNIKTLLLIIQFCLCILNSPRSKYFIKFSLMVFDSQICSANTIPQVRSCRLITHKEKRLLLHHMRFSRTRIMADALYRLPFPVFQASLGNRIKEKWPEICVISLHRFRERGGI